MGNINNFVIKTIFLNSDGSKEGFAIQEICMMATNLLFLPDVFLN